MATSTAPDEAPAAPDSRALPDTHDARHRAHCRICAAPEGTALADLARVKIPPVDAYVAALVAYHAPDAKPAPLPRLLAAVRGPQEG